MSLFFANSLLLSMRKIHPINLFRGNILTCDMRKSCFVFRVLVMCTLAYWDT